MVIMTYPLCLLRQYNINKLEILEANEEIIFGKLSWPKNVRTNYLIWRPSHEGSIKEYYTLESLLCLLKNVHLPHAVYVKRAATGNIPAVRRPDRKDLLAYLKGEITTSASIDKSAPLEIPNQVKRPHGNRVCESEAKRPRIDDVQRVRKRLIARFEAHEDEINESVAKRLCFETHAQRIRQHYCQFEADTGSEVGESGAKKSYVNDIRVQRVRKQLAARFEAMENAAVKVDNVMSLTEAMSVEKIAAIKAKRLVRKRTTIKRNNTDTVIDSDGAILDYDDDVIISREKLARTRSTLLQSSGKVLAGCVLGLLQSIKMREEPPVVLEVPAILPTAILAVPVRRVPYSRYDQERFITRDMEGFKIDTMGSYQGMILKSVVEGHSIPLARHIARNVRDPRLMPRLPVPSTQPPRTPIIIIPAAPTSLISMLNVKDVLQDQRFVSVEQKKAQGVVRENELLIQRRKEERKGDSNIDTTIPYRVVDNPARLSAAEWECVVAAFVLGPSWQFKGWPMEGKPVEIFSKICPFHLKYDEMKLDVRVSRWSTTVLQLSRTSRHSDRAVLRSFWDTLDKHMVTKKPHLRF